MPQNKAREIAQKILGLADIKIGGMRPWDITVKNDDFYDRVLRQGSMGLGESYMDGWWDVEKLDQFFSHFLRAKLDRKDVVDLKSIFWLIRHVLFNRQKKSSAYKIGEHHYDIGNDLYGRMLDRRMTYTCGYWENAQNLDEAQEAKLDLVCRKLNLKPGQKILDIGCGWGSFMKFAAEKYGVSAVGITVSKEQVELAKKICEGWPIEIHLNDYREIEGEFDHIVSLGMFEHVGYKNYRTYMEVVHKHLKDDGLFLLHTCGWSESAKSIDPWIEKYIFPNSMMPSIKQIGGAIEKLFVMEDWHNFGADYDKTLMAWIANFQKAWPELKGKYNERFYRMWMYYLSASVGTFRARRSQLWQIVLSKKGRLGGYKSLR